MKHWYVLLLGVGLALGGLRAESGEVDPVLGAPFLTRNRPWLGKPDAAVVVVEVGAFNCNHCQAFHQRLFSPLKKKYIDAGLVRWTMLPAIPVGTPSGGGGIAVNPEEPNTRLAAIGHVATHQGRYWEILDLLFKQFEIPRTELDAKLANGIGLAMPAFTDALVPGGSAFADVIVDVKEGIQLNIRRTPTFIIRKRLSNGGYAEARVEGYQPQDYFERVIQSVIDAR